MYLSRIPSLRICLIYLVLPTLKWPSVLSHLPIFATHHLPESHHLPKLQALMSVRTTWYWTPISDSLKDHDPGHLSCYLAWTCSSSPFFLMWHLIQIKALICCLQSLCSDRQNDFSLVSIYFFTQSKRISHKHRLPWGKLNNCRESKDKTRLYEMILLLFSGLFCWLKYSEFKMQNELKFV